MVMYSLTRLDDQSQELFESKDQLMMKLEHYNTVAKMENLTYPIKLVQTDHDTGEILDNAQFTLPLERTIDNLLSNFGGKKSKSKKSLPIPDFTSRLKPSVDQEPKDFPKHDLSELISAPEEDGNSQLVARRRTSLPVQLKKQDNKVQKVGTRSFPLSFGKVLSIASVLGLFALGGLVVIQQSKLSTLEKQVAALKPAQETQPVIEDNIDHKLNVFGRYFLSHYYNEKTSDFSSFSDQELSAQSGQLASIILEEVNKTSDGYQVTFVITVTKDNKPENKRLTFEVTESENFPYGFVVTTSPEETTYPTK